MPKMSKNGTIIKPQNLKVMPGVTKFGWQGNISKPSEIENSKLNSLDFLGCYIQWVSRFIKSNFWKNKRFMTSFMCHCWSEISQRRCKWMKYCSLNWMRVTAKSRRLRQFAIAQSTSANQKVIYQVYTTWFVERLSLGEKYLEAYISNATLTQNH